MAKVMPLVVTLDGDGNGMLQHNNMRDNNQLSLIFCPIPYGIKGASWLGDTGCGIFGDYATWDGFGPTGNGYGCPKDVRHRDHAWTYPWIDET